MLDFDTILVMVTTGLFTGLGSALGNYLAQRAFIKNIERIEKYKK